MRNRYVSHSLQSLLDQVTDKKARGFLRAQWFGDMACSSGLHGVEGLSLPFSQIMTRIQESYSDDLITTLATYILWRRFSSEQVNMSPQTLEIYKDRYVALVSPYFRDAPQLYGRTFPLLMRSSGLDYLRIATENRGPGAAARVGIVAYLAKDELLKKQALLLLAGVSHLHPESIAGVFAIANAIRQARKLTTPKAMLEAAIHGAAIGATVARKLLSDLGLPIRQHADLVDSVSRVWETENPAAALLAGEHMVSAKFAVASTFLIAKRALFQNNSLLKTIVEQSYAIGGDPDTICAMAFGIVYAIHPIQISKEITQVVQKYGLDDPFRDVYNVDEESTES